MRACHPCSRPALIDMPRMLPGPPLVEADGLAGGTPAVLLPAATFRPGGGALLGGARRRLQPPSLLLQILGCLFPLCCRLCRWVLGLAAAAAGHVLTLAVCARR